MTSVSSSGDHVVEEESTGNAEWEMRPGGMLVQKRSDIYLNNDLLPPAALNLRLRVFYGDFRYHITVNSQATFGEVKKVLKAETGLEPSDQKIKYKGKERQNGEYLDRCGVRDGSKLVLMEHPLSIERRYIEMRKNSRIQAGHRAISDLSIEVDKLADQVSVIEKSISSGTKVAEVQITTLIEMLMRQAVKLDAISADGDASPRKIKQSKRVQKCVEMLDALKISNTKVVKPVIVTSNWDTFHPSSAASSNSQWQIFD